MLKSVEGVYRDGRVGLLESPPAGVTGRVIIDAALRNTLGL
jgi:hypothetical protein